VASSSGGSPPPPLFSLELVVRDGDCITYRVPPSAFTDVVVSVYDRAAASVQDIPQLEKFVMEGLFWSDTPMLQTIASHEGVVRAANAHLGMGCTCAPRRAVTRGVLPQVPACRTKFSAALAAALPPAHDYCALYERFESVVKLDVAEFIAEYAANEELTVQDMTADVKKHEVATPDPRGIAAADGPAPRLTPRVSRRRRRSPPRTTCHQRSTSASST